MFSKYQNYCIMHSSFDQNLYLYKNIGLNRYQKISEYMCIPFLGYCFKISSVDLVNISTMVRPMIYVIVVL